MAAQLDSIHTLAHQLVRRQQTGSAQGQGPSTVSGFLWSLILPGLLCLFFVTLFLVFRTRFRRIYEPRSYLGKFPENYRTQKTSQSMFGWIKDFWNVPDEMILSKNSIDGFLYLRFYKIIFIIALVGTCLTWPILFPVYATGNGGRTFFNILSLSNISNQPNRYYAAVFISWIFFGFVMFMIARETLFYIHVRQAYLLSPRVASRISSRTVCFTDVPDEYLSKDALRAVYPDVEHIWIATDTKDLEDMDEDRQKTALKLEAAECKLLNAANKQRMKASKKGENLEDPMAWADEHKRPTHRLKPLVGTKVDTIDWCRNHLQELIPKVESQQEEHVALKAKQIKAVFIEFSTIQAAESAFQQLNFSHPKLMQPRAIGVSPNEIIWHNLSIPWWRRDLLYAVATALVCLLILCWTPLTVFAGAITNIFYLERISFLTWLSKVPSVITGIITGLLPSLIITILMALVPMFLKMFAKLAGVVSTGEQELMVQGWYFWFQFIIVFLITTFSSGAASVGKQIAMNPSSAPTLLAQNIPTASNFYISYFVLTGLSTFGSTLVNIGALAVYLILGKLLDKTPRKKYKRYVNVSGIGWGSTYPKYTTIAVIAIIYSMIAPLILGFATVGLALLYIAFRYELVYVLDTSQMNTRGDTYRKALQQLTTGVYVAEVCMIGIFAMDIGNYPAAAGPMVLMIIFLVATILFHIAMNAALKPLLRGLPRDLLARNAYKRAMRSKENDDLERGDTNGADSAYVPHNRSLGQDDSTLGGNETNTSANPEKFLEKFSVEPQKPYGDSKWKNALHNFLHPDAVPALDDFLMHSLDDYSEEDQKNAYVAPVISNQTPVIWIPHDGFGGSQREIDATKGITRISDEGAWWDQKTGKLEVIWENSGHDEWKALEGVPVFQEGQEY